MAIFTILYGNYYPAHGEFKLICLGKFSRRTWVNFTQQYEKNRRRCQQNIFYYAVWQLLLYFYREFHSKILRVRLTLCSYPSLLYSSFNLTMVPVELWRVKLCDVELGPCRVVSCRNDGPPIFVIVRNFRDFHIRTDWAIGLKFRVIEKLLLLFHRNESDWHWYCP